MVDTNVEIVFVVTDTRSVACFAVAVGEVLCNDMSAVGNGSVVEIATENDALPVMLFKETFQAFDLRSPTDSGFRKFSSNVLRSDGRRVDCLLRFS